MKKIQQYFLCYFLLLSFSLDAMERSTSGKIETFEPLWKIHSLIEVGDQKMNGEYKLAGIPDGIGVMRIEKNKLSIFINHEIGSDKGIARRHGGRGAIVSHWIIDLKDLSIKSGEDLISEVRLWNRNQNQFEIKNNEVINRLCSGDLADPSAFYDASTGRGSKARMFLSGEEDRDGGRAFAHIITGKEKGVTYELPHLGKLSWENVVAHPRSGIKTIVMGMDDNKDGQVYLYLGEKKFKGNAIERAGLINGELFGIEVTEERFNLVELGDVSKLSGSELEKLGIEKNIARFKRPEDGAWDRQNKNVFYFATTDKIDGVSEIFQLTFDDINNPRKGGSIQSILNAKEIGAQMFDNLTVSDNGKILIDEDPGDHEHLASIWDFDTKTKKATKLFSAKPEFFQDKTHANFLTIDKEHSGIIDITRLVTGAPWYKKDERYFLGTLQIHKKIDDPKLVELGELYFISGPK